jgi:hypothetical protein
VNGEKPGDLLVLYLFLFAFMIGCACLFYGDTIFCEYVSRDAAFHVDLQKDKNYALWVIDALGPEMVEVSIRNGSYIAFGDSFMLMHPEGDYLPYHPGFSVRETGRYDIIVHSLDPGTIRIKVQQDTGLRPSRITRDSSHSTGAGLNPGISSPSYRNISGREISLPSLYTPSL